MEKYRILTYYAEAKQLRQGEICKPRMAIIYPAYGCNLSCNGCLCNVHNGERKFMNLESLKKLVKELKDTGVEAIELCGGGEPLIHPEIKEIIKFITDDMGLALGIITNGTLLTPELSELIVSRASYVRISVYNSTWQIITKKIKYLIALKREMGTNIRIGGKLLASKRNKELIVQQTKELNDIGCELISIKAERNSSDELDESEVCNLQRKLSDLNLAQLSESLNKSQCEHQCWMVPIHTLIDPNGEVYICCYYMGREKTHSLGNAFERGFSDIWWSEDHIKKMESIEQNQCNTYDCRWHHYNKVMDYLFTTSEIQHQFC